MGGRSDVSANVIVVAVVGRCCAASGSATTARAARLNPLII
jgi:hypothetical protein